MALVKKPSKTQIFLVFVCLLGPLLATLLIFSFARSEAKDFDRLSNGTSDVRANKTRSVNFTLSDMPSIIIRTLGIEVYIIEVS